MSRTPKVTDAEVIACFKSAEGLLSEMHDFSHRIQMGHYGQMENPVEYAREFALLAEAAASMACRLLLVNEIQQQKAELAKLKAGQP